jgi:BASS family bile acid:Na+ symporter
MLLLRKFCWRLFPVVWLVALVGYFAGYASFAYALATAGCVLFAIGLGANANLASYQFTAWVVTSVIAALLYPDAFAKIPLGNNRVLQIRENNLLTQIVVQLVMFGMGTHMSLRDFAGLGKMSYGILVGTFLQFTIMPVVGYSIGRALGLEPEIAAGFVLIGACSSGLASNVMTHIAKANLPLSITQTAFSTLVAPFMTPFWMNLLVGKTVNVPFMKWVLIIVKLVLIPIGAALVHDLLTRAKPNGKRIVYVLAVVSAGIIVWLLTGGWTIVSAAASDQQRLYLETAAYALGAVAVGVVYHLLASITPKITKFMALLSMFGIIFFTVTTTAEGQESLSKVGWWILLGVMVHNTIGYFLGYWLSRMFGLDENSARSISLEVGLHNGGMAVGIARELGKLGTLGLAAAIFSPWMNVSGSLLANYWRRKRPKE